MYDYAVYCLPLSFATNTYLGSRAYDKKCIRISPISSTCLPLVATISTCNIVIHPRNQIYIWESWTLERFFVCHHKSLNYIVWKHCSSWYTYICSWSCISYKYRAVLGLWESICKYIRRGFGICGRNCNISLKICPIYNCLIKPTLWVNQLYWIKPRCSNISKTVAINAIKL